MIFTLSISLLDLKKLRGRSVTGGQPRLGSCCLRPSANAPAREPGAEQAFTIRAPVSTQRLPAPCREKQACSPLDCTQFFSLLTTPSSGEHRQLQNEPPRGSRKQQKAKPKKPRREGEPCLPLLRLPSFGKHRQPVHSPPGASPTSAEAAPSAPRSVVPTVRLCSPAVLPRPGSGAAAAFLLLFYPRQGGSGGSPPLSIMAHYR